MRAVGLMSGTSLDGVDAAYVSILPRGDGYAAAVERFITVPFETNVRERLLASLPPHVPGSAALAELDRDLGLLFARAALSVASGAEIDYVASHGLTAFHRGEDRLTMQIGDPYRLRDALSASVVFDFRRADCAADGNGAPLVPYVDALLLSSRDQDVVALNLGGIANVTVLRRGAAPQEATAWDTGPGNMLVDAFVRARTGGAERLDRDGSYAARGAVDERAVGELVAREAMFLVLPPPKSTGRERFGSQLLEAHGDLFARLSLEDGCATLCAFTVATIANSLAIWAPYGASIIASGGGTRNPALFRMLRARLERDGFEVFVSDELGIDADAKEALAFAVLGYETLRGRPANVPSATGAVRPAVLGAIVPHALDALLAKMRAEIAANRRL